MNGMLFAVMLPSTKNNSPALPADTGEAATTGRRKKHVCRCSSQKPIEEKRSLEKLNCMTLNVSATLERKLYREPSFRWIIENTHLFDFQYFAK